MLPQTHQLAEEGTPLPIPHPTECLASSPLVLALNLGGMVPKIYFLRTETGARYLYQ